MPKQLMPKQLMPKQLMPKQLMPKQLMPFGHQLYSPIKASTASGTHCMAPTV
jgi:hypothetical protein